MKIWKIAAPVVVIALFVVWYIFRPERLYTNRAVDEGMPSGGPASPAQALESGAFYSILHPTAGTATVYRMADGTHVLRFTNFRTSNGPDVHVYMVAAGDAKDNATVLQAGFIDLGVIKGNIGDQNYTLGPEVDLGRYRAVSVWCKRFSVNFGAAPLTPDRGAVSQK
jgi:Electron transfer DM13